MGTPRINAEIEKMLGNIKGLRKHNGHHAMRTHTESLKQQSLVVYDYEPLDESSFLETGTKKVKVRPLHKFNPLPPLAVKGTAPKKSSDEKVSYIEDEFGRIAIPMNTVAKAIFAYDTSNEVSKSLNLKETEQMRVNLERLANFVSPSPRRRMKRSKYEKRTFSKDLYSRLNHSPLNETQLSMHITAKYGALFREDLVSQYTGRESPFRHESRLKVGDMLKCWNDTELTPKSRRVALPLVSKLRTRE
jgi:hypothetical protein